MMQAKVIEVVERSNLVLVVLQMGSGDIAAGMVVGNSTGRWQVLDISTAPPDAWRAGRRLVALKPLDASASPAVGCDLVEVPVELLLPLNLHDGLERRDIDGHHGGE